MGSQSAASFLTNIARAAFSHGLGATALKSSPYTVDDGHRVVLFDHFRGVIDDTVGEGTHFLIPCLQKPFIFDIRTRPHTFYFVSSTKDLQTVNLKLRVLSRPEVNCLPDIFKTLLNMMKKFSPPSATRSLRLWWPSSMATRSSPTVPTHKRRFQELQQ
ncbi:prohibitin-3 mitochondrial [Phtheirospermum japonicum]|uniref:Prohibitin n=1 Tax=Phtheirospermum japonicum TaxID=374723 RepID=A0A830BVN1_9LAMI|nr:prohibitin-3 mitochondrial [Phtheirospermum japonicum]